MLGGRIAQKQPSAHWTGREPGSQFREWYISRMLHQDWKPGNIAGQLQTWRLLQVWRHCSLLLSTRQRACSHVQHLLPAFHCYSHTLEDADHSARISPLLTTPHPSSQNTTLTDTQVRPIGPKHLFSQLSFNQVVWANSNTAQIVTKKHRHVQWVNKPTIVTWLLFGLNLDDRL